jgi:hypothetical protein
VAFTPKRFTHDPNASLRYGFDWAAEGWLPVGDTIVTSTWSITKAVAGDNTLVLSVSTHDSTTTAIRATGGTVGNDYQITNHIVTSAGDSDDRSHILKCRER